MKIKGKMECAVFKEEDSYYKVEASKRKDAADLMELHYKKHHSSFTSTAQNDIKKTKQEICKGNQPRT